MSCPGAYAYARSTCNECRRRSGFLESHFFCAGFLDRWFARDDGTGHGMGGVALGERLSLSGGAARSAWSVGSAPRPNSRPWGIDAILARAAGGLSSAIATRTALARAAGGLRSAGATRTASRAA